MVLFLKSEHSQGARRTASCLPTQFDGICRSSPLPVRTSGNPADVSYPSCFHPEPKSRLPNVNLVLLMKGKRLPSSSRSGACLQTCTRKEQVKPVCTVQGKAQFTFFDGVNLAGSQNSSSSSDTLSSAERMSLAKVLSLMEDTKSLTGAVKSRFCRPSQAVEESISTVNLTMHCTKACSWAICCCQETQRDQTRG